MDLVDESATVSVPAQQSAPPLTITVGEQSYTVDPTDGPITIGRQFPAQVQINDPRISRNHLRIEAQADRWTAVDHSTNGTYSAGARQGFFVLADAMTIHLGDPDGIPVSFAYAVSGGSAQTATGAPPAAADGDVDGEDAEGTPEGEATNPGVARAGAAVSARRRELDISQRTLAREKIINAGALIAFEKGRSWPHRSTQAKLEKVLGWEPGTISRLRRQDDTEPGEQTEILTNTVQAPLMAEAVELAMDTIKSTVDALPEPTDPEFSSRITGVLKDLRKLESLAANAARAAKGAPDVVLVLSSVRKLYRDLMLRAARSPQATPGQKLFAARHRSELTVEEAANAAGVSAEDVTAAEADLPLGADAAAAVGELLTSLTRR